MKKFVKILSILAIAILMTSCGGKEDEKIFSEGVFVETQSPLGGFPAPPYILETPYGDFMFSVKTVDRQETVISMVYTPFGSPYSTSERPLRSLENFISKTEDNPITIPLSDSTYVKIILDETHFYWIDVEVYKKR
ncbi:MAG: hypothetical protein LBI53_05995 [Candidatus Peribacteria bacterium]|nr:hypothetical protein [Candidatus Peribacteria bacterium]